MTSHVRGSFGAAMTLGATASGEPASHAIRSRARPGLSGPGASPHRERGAPEKERRRAAG